MSRLVDGRAARLQGFLRPHLRVASSAGDAPRRSTVSELAPIAARPPAWDRESSRCRPPRASPRRRADRGVRRALHSAHADRRESPRALRRPPPGRARPRGSRDPTGRPCRPPATARRQRLDALAARLTGRERQRSQRVDQRDRIRPARLAPPARRPRHRPCSASASRSAACPSARAPRRTTASSWRGSAPMSSPVFTFGHDTFSSTAAISARCVAGLHQLGELRRGGAHHVRDQRRRQVASSCGQVLGQIARQALVRQPDRVDQPRRRLPQPRRRIARARLQRDRLRDVRRERELLVQRCRRTPCRAAIASNVPEPLIDRVRQRQAAELARSCRHAGAPACSSTRSSSAASITGPSTHTRR